MWRKRGRLRVVVVSHDHEKEPTLATTITPRFETLLSGFKGRIFEPGDAEFAPATQTFNLTIVQQPALVAFPVDEDDVITIVDFARSEGLRVAPQRTGHNAEPLGSLDDVILVRTDDMRGVEIDAQRRVARVRAGSKWEEVVPAASELGLAALHGSTPDVSVVGYSLGGGLGWYARKLGLAANSVLAIEVVTADGRLRRVDADHEPELFWALRGGGGNFGVVTAIEIALYEIPEVYAGVLFFDWERSAEVLKAWLDWTATVPDEMTSVGRILQFPPFPEVPAEFRGRQFAVVEVIFTGTRQDGDALVAPLRALGPDVDTIAMVPPVGISELHMDPPDPLPYLGEGSMLGTLDAEAIDRFVAAVGPGSGSSLISAELRHVGGELHRARPGNGAIATLDAEFVTFAVGAVMDDQSVHALDETLARLRAALEPYDNGREYLNFAEHQTNPARFYRPATYARLRAARAAYDPGQLFKGNHEIAPSH